MAKGDSGEMQNLINQQQKQAQGTLTGAQNQTQSQYNNMLGNYNQGVAQNMNNYQGIMGGYQDFLGGGAPSGRTPMSGGNPGGMQAPAFGGPNIYNSGMQGGDRSTTTYQPSGNVVSPGMTGGGNTPQISAPTRDPAAIDQWLQARSQDPNSDPILKTPEGRQYYAQKITETDGLTPSNTDYWTKKSTLASAGGAVGAGGGNLSNIGLGGLSGTIGGWQNFADTGGFTPQGLADIRARAVAPTRSIYSSAQANVDRQRELQHGYSPNATAAQAKMARDESAQIGDINTNANAAIAQMVQQGQLAGMQGLTGAQLGGEGMQLGALSGMTGAYGSTPGMANTFGNQVLGSNTQNLEGSQLQNQLAQILFSAKLGQSQIPGNYQQALGNIGGTLGLIGSGAGLLGGFGGGQTPLASRQTTPNMGYLPVGLTGGMYGY